MIATFYALTLLEFQVLLPPLLSAIVVRFYLRFFFQHRIIIINNAEKWHLGTSFGANTEIDYLNGVFALFVSIEFFMCLFFQNSIIIGIKPEKRFSTFANVWPVNQPTTV